MATKESNKIKCVNKLILTADPGYSIEERYEEYIDPSPILLNERVFNYEFKPKPVKVSERFPIKPVCADCFTRPVVEYIFPFADCTSVDSLNKSISFLNNPCPPTFEILFRLSLVAYEIDGNYKTSKKEPFNPNCVRYIKDQFLFVIENRMGFAADEMDDFEYLMHTYPDVHILDDCLGPRTELIEFLTKNNRFVR